MPSFRSWLHWPPAIMAGGSLPRGTSSIHRGATHQIEPHCFRCSRPLRLAHRIPRFCQLTGNAARTPCGYSQTSRVPGSSRCRNSSARVIGSFSLTLRMVELPQFEFAQRTDHRQKMDRETNRKRQANRSTQQPPASPFAHGPENSNVGLAADASFPAAERELIVRRQRDIFNATCAAT